MDVVFTLLGVALVALALRDIFEALFHHSGKAVLSKPILRGTWSLMHWLAARRRSVLSLAGPLALLAVVATWAGLIVAGWALVLLPHMPGGFRLGSAPAGDLLDALYLSLVTMTTLGYGDIVPETAVLRLLLPFEALLGFGLLTASIAWLLSIYPVLARRRSLAYEVNLLRQAEVDGRAGPLPLDSGAAEGVYSELTSRLVAVERDHVMFPVAYYFADLDERFSLPVAMPYLLELAERGSARESPPGVRLRAVMLWEAIQDFATTMAERFHGEAGGSPTEALAAYARDHLRTLVT